MATTLWSWGWPTVTDLTPGVRDRAIAAAGAILCDWVGLADAQKWAAPPVVDAVVAVVAPEIARPLQARIEELEAGNEAADCPSCAQMKQWYGPDGDRDALKARVTELEYERDALKAQLRLEVVHCGEFQLLTAKFDAENLELRDQAGEMAEELTFLRGEAALIERGEARVELLTAALTGLCNAYHVASLDDLYGADETISGEQNRAEYEAWVTARAALAAGTTDV